MDSAGLQTPSKSVSRTFIFGGQHGR